MLPETENVEHWHLTVAALSVANGSSIVDDDVAVAKSRLRKRNVQDARPSWIETLCPDDFSLTIRVEAHRRGATGKVDFPLSFGNVDAVCLPSPAGDVPLSQSRCGDPHVPRGSLVVGVELMGELAPFQTLFPLGQVLVVKPKVVRGHGPARVNLGRLEIEGDGGLRVARLAQGVPLRVVLVSTRTLGVLGEWVLEHLDRPRTAG